LKRRQRGAGFTLVEVLVALIIVAMALAALMTAVSGTATASGYLRDKAVAQWIALNRIVEVRMAASNTVQKFGASTDAGELDFANRHWHYDTRYFPTSIASMQRVVVRVYAGNPDTKGNPLAEATGFLGTAVTTPGQSNAFDWTTGSTVATANCGIAQTTSAGSSSGGTVAGGVAAGGTPAQLGAATNPNCPPAGTTTGATTTTTTNTNTTNTNTTNTGANTTNTGKSTTTTTPVVP
jgi:general secretion pathway protein I